MYTPVKAMFQQYYQPFKNCPNFLESNKKNIYIEKYRKVQIFAVTSKFK
jgi:hypothetical protein